MNYSNLINFLPFLFLSQFFFSLTTESTLFRSHRVLQFTGFLKLTTAPFKQAEERKNGRRNDSMINLHEVMLPTLITRRGFELSRPAESIMYKENNNGLRTVPCWTPYKTGAQSEVSSLNGETSDWAPVSHEFLFVCNKERNLSS